MASRKVDLFLLVQALLAIVCSAPSLAGEFKPKEWDRTKAAQYLDQRGEAWFNFGSANRGEGSSAMSCVSCHSLLPYALARPVLRRISNDNLPTKWESKVIEQTRRRIANWDRLDMPEFQLYYDFDDPKKKQSRGTEAVLNALVLALDDKLHGRQEASDDTKKAISILWSTQITQGQQKGSWEWLNFGMDPWEANGGRYMGAALAAIAVGSAPGNGRSTADGDAQARLDSLRHYLKQQFGSQNVHNKVWMLWASATTDGLLTQSEKDELIHQLLAKQQSGGGWSLGSLGDYTHGEIKTPATAPDGYATGLILHVLQLAGRSKDDPQVNKGLTWLRENQDPTGAWRATSVNKNRSPESTNPAKAHVGKFMWDAATGYAVLALSH
jgi:squalene-hopene/tetraprenyl-beta-curcumene cyclase